MPEDRSRKRSILFLALVLIAATVYSFFVSQGTPVLAFSAQNRTFGFRGSKSTSVTFRFDDLTRLELHEGTSSDFGVPAGGGKVWGGYHYGTWKSDSLGEYEAFVTERFGTCIVVQDGEKTAVFNTSNEETTRNLFRQLDDFRKNGSP